MDVPFSPCLKACFAALIRGENHFWDVGSEELLPDSRADIGQVVWASS